MKTALIYHPIYLKHDTGPHHPERASRLQAILRKLQKTDLINKLQLTEPGKASIDDIALVHHRSYIAKVKDAVKNGLLNLDPDTVISQDSFEAALFAAGGVINAIDLVFKGGADNAFCMVRPPGHHARPSQAMGFCIFNNIAIAARYLQKQHGIERVVVIDWDVHHGNGTEEAFYDDESVLYISLHQYPHYPGTGAREDNGKDKGKGFNLNLPMPAGSGDNEYIKVFKELVVPKVNSFKPQFILISAGFDGHRDDPLSSITLTEKGYYEMTAILKESAKLYSENRIVSVLEGGYNLFSLADSVHAHLEALTT
ncbi:MAG: histone deacetylase [Candidatus Omnitrophica bacterium]|nr:histone deacetylase [Candidatus Omnitrophota bacterium]